MKKRGVYVGAGLSCVFAMAAAVLAATINSPEKWSNGTVEGWLASDFELRSFPSQLSNPDSALQLHLSAVTAGIAAERYIRANVSSSLAKFVGSYGGASSVSFRFRCEQYLPAPYDANAGTGFYLCLSSKGHRWFYRLNDPAGVGAWIRYNVPLSYSAGWYTFETVNTAESFAADLGDVEWIGVLMQQNGNLADQSFSVDEFALATSAMDSDGDGMPDFAEDRAGTDPYDPSSVLRLNVTQSADGITIVWQSNPSVTYQVWRTEDLKAGYGDTPHAAGIPGRSDSATTEYTDSTVVGNGPFFYRVTVQP